MAGIQKVEFITGAYTGVKDTGDAVTATDFLEEGLEPGSEEPQDITYGDGEIGQDGVTVEGQVNVVGSVLPTAGTRTWIRFTGNDGTKTVVGGTRGCRIRIGKGGARQHASGPQYTMVKFSCTGAESGSCIATEAA